MTVQKAEDKPLFVPLTARWYDAFSSGAKTKEFRRYGPRWNERTCTVGRVVTLSRGYGKKDRLRGTIIGFRVVGPDAHPDIREVYPDADRIAEIEVDLPLIRNALAGSAPPVKDDIPTPALPQTRRFEVRYLEREDSAKSLTQILGWHDTLEGAERMARSWRLRPSVSAAWAVDLQADLDCSTPIIPGLAWPEDGMATPVQEAACRSNGTHQCAALCLSHSTNFPCPVIATIWTEDAITAERERRPNGPLRDFN